jgi:hypothetical protein
VLLLLAAWRFFPAAEYILGGKDPGVYVTEGLQIDRTGDLFRRDRVVADLPAEYRDLFVRSHDNPLYYGIRFMGVYVNDPATGEVISHFPHVYPASIALGYRWAGLNGATNMVGFWAALGLLSVYFFGARLLGRWPAFVAVAVLALNVVEVWFGRYPGVEMLMQALLFSTVLALARLDDGDVLFGWIAGALCVLLLLLRFDSFMGIAAIAAALAARWVALGRAPHWGFVGVVTAGAALALAYYAGPMRQNYFIYRVNLPSATVLAAAAVAAAGLLALALRWRARIGPVLAQWTPWALAVAVTLLAVYALFFRQPGGKLAEADAATLRVFRDAYVFWPALAAAIAGYAIAVRRAFWRDPIFFVLLAIFGLFFFYKIRIVQEQFWMARRFVPLILPAVMLMAAACAFGMPPQDRRRRAIRVAAATAFMAFIGVQYVRAAAPVAAHREYRGAIAHVADLAALFTPRDLILVETRNIAGDFHVLATPLAYVHDLNVLVLDSIFPDRRLFESFLADALSKYDRVLFVTGGGSDFHTRKLRGTPLAFRRLEIPEFETTDWRDVPDEPRRKDLSYSVFQLTLDGPPAGPFVLDLGYLDDMHVVNFYAREIESTEGRTFRWTQDQSFVPVTNLAGSERELTVVASAGGRPPTAAPAQLEVYLDDVLLGRVTVTEGFREYRFALPGDAVKAAASRETPAQVRLKTDVWVPAELVAGSADTRPLGVMVDRIAVH